MGVVMIKKTKSGLWTHCPYCRVNVQNWRHIHYNTLEEFLEISDQQREIAAARKERKRLTK